MAGYRAGGEFDERESGRGLGVDGDLAGSLVVNLKESTNRWYELLYSRQETSVEDTNVDLTPQYLNVDSMAAFAACATPPPFSERGPPEHRCRPRKRRQHPAWWRASRRG